MIISRRTDWSREEVSAAVQIMEKMSKCLDAGLQLPIKVHQAHLGCKINVTTEIVAINENSEVWLGERPDDPDDTFHGQLDIPGTTHLLQDTRESALARANGKLLGAAIIAFRFFDVVYISKESARGPYISLLHEAKIQGRPTAPGEFSDPDGFPERLVTSCGDRARLVFSNRRFV